MAQSEFASNHIGEPVLSQAQIKQGVALVVNELNAQFTDAVIISVVPRSQLEFCKPSGWLLLVNNELPLDT